MQKMNGTISPAAKCKSNNTPTIRPTLFSDLTLASQSPRTAPSIARHSRPSPAATASALLLQRCRGACCTARDRLRAALTQRSASPDRQTHQHAQDPGQEDRPEDEVADQ